MVKFSASSIYLYNRITSCGSVILKIREVMTNKLSGPNHMLKYNRSELSNYPMTDLKF